MPPLLKACLNGARSRDEHPAIPRTPKELAREARDSVDAGAKVLHLHPYDGDVQTLEAEPCGAAVRAVREACPGIPISLSTMEHIEPDPARRFELIAAWTELPELVTANQDEPGIIELCEHLIGRGVGIEAGLLSVEVAKQFVESGIAGRCVRALIEPLDPDPAVALADAAAMEQILVDAGLGIEQVHHGDGMASWEVMRRAVARGHGIRAGLEDMTVLPDGSRPTGNGDLVRAAAALFSESQT